MFVTCLSQVRHNLPHAPQIGTCCTLAPFEQEQGCAAAVPADAQLQTYTSHISGHQGSIRSGGKEEKAFVPGKPSCAHMNTQSITIPN